MFKNHLRTIIIIDHGEDSITIQFLRGHNLTAIHTPRNSYWVRMLLFIMGECVWRLDEYTRYGNLIREVYKREL